MEPNARQVNQRLPRYHRLDTYGDVRIGRPKHFILKALADMHYLTARQLARLLFSPSSLTYAQEHLKQLFHAGYVQRVFLPSAKPSGSSLAVYTLDKKGFAYVMTAEGASGGRFRATEQVRREWLFLEHTLSVNDFLILTEHLAKRSNTVSIFKMLHERALKRTPIYVQDGKERIGVVPDCWLDLRQGPAQACLAVEIDHSGRVEQKPFQRKVRGFVESVKGPYQQVFGTDSITVVVVAMKGEGRLREVIRWTEKELEEIKATNLADIFRFAAFDPAEADPHEVFFSPIWRRPFDSDPLPLLEDDSSERTVN